MEEPPTCAFPRLALPARRTALVLATCILATILPACLETGGEEGGDRDPFVAEEKRFDAIYAATPIDVEGSVLDEEGIGLPDVTVSTLGWGDAEANAGRSTIADATGRFRLGGLRRRSVLLRLSCPGHHDELIAVDLHRPIEEEVAGAGETVLTATRPGLVRFVIGGDTMFGRRFVDRDEDGVEGEPEDLIQAESRAEDSRALLRFLREFLMAADVTTVNLETAVIANPTAIHPYKEFKFHSHPETIGALVDAGVDSVSLGNNHVYDCLEEGMLETLRNVSAAGLDVFGAGTSATDAEASVLRRAGNGVDYALQGFDGIVPIHFPPWGPDPWPDDLLYVARDTPRKGGALELTRENIESFLAAETPSRLSIPVLHGGWEYGEYPSENMRARIRGALEDGAGFVVAHHPHTLYGIARLEGDSSGRPAFLSLGNLLFDQDVFETFQAAFAIVDVEKVAAEAGPEGWKVRAARLVPFHIEGYVPKPVAGAWADRIARHIGHLSTHLPASPMPGEDPDGLVGCVVFPSRNRVFVALDPSRFATSDSEERLVLRVSGGSTGPIAYARSDPSDSLAGIRTDAPASCEHGRELLHHGDFEDLDVDDQFHEGYLWNQSDQRFVEQSCVRSGTGAMVLLRDSESTSEVVTWPRNRVGFSPDALLTIRGEVRGENAGTAQVVVRWYVREERDVISTETVFAREAGTYDWEPFAIDLVPPPGAGTVRFYLQLEPPRRGRGRAFFDDVALIQWEGTIPDASAAAEFATPNNWGWLRFTPFDAEAAELGVTLTHRVYREVP